MKVEGYSRIFLAASLEKVRARIWEESMFSFSTMYAFLAVMVVVLPACACEDQLGGLDVFLTGGGAGGVLGRRGVNLHFFESPLDHWMLFQLRIVSHVLKQQIQVCNLLLIKTFDKFVLIFIEHKHP